MISFFLPPWNIPVPGQIIAFQPAFGLHQPPHLLSSLLLQFFFLCFDLVDFVLCGARLVLSWIGGDIQLQCSDGIIITLRALRSESELSVHIGPPGGDRRAFLNSSMETL